MISAAHLLGVVVVILFGYSSALELDSNETNVTLTAEVCLGKRLKLSVKNIYYPKVLWRLNGYPVSEKCETKFTPVGHTIVCADMDWSDAGLYEFQGITEKGHKELLLAVDVKIVNPRNDMVAEQRIEPVIDQQCFCSGITDNCTVADNLFRYKIVASVPDSDLIELSITRTEVEESSSSTSDLSTYVILPQAFKGNLLKSYGGYIHFPSIDDDFQDEQPLLILKSKNQTLVYYEREDSEASGELNQRRVLLTEKNWQRLNSSNITRDTFLAVLSYVEEFYIKFAKFNSFWPMNLVLDSADTKDHGLGKVTTVEKCNCRIGYNGLSCESCARGFYRRTAIREQGVCVSIRQKIESIRLKQKLSLRTNQINSK